MTMFKLVLHIAARTASARRAFGGSTGLVRHRRGSVQLLCGADSAPPVADQIGAPHMKPSTLESLKRRV